MLRKRNWCWMDKYHDYFKVSGSAGWLLLDWLTPPPVPPDALRLCPSVLLS